MNRSIRYLIIAALVICIIGYAIYQARKRAAIVPRLEILLAIESPLDTLGVAIKGAFRSVLEEEGFPFRIASRDEILRFSPKEIVHFNPLIIFPDHISQKLPEEFKIWIEEYIKVGGHVFISYDSGIRMRNNRFRRQAIFSSILGLNYITYDKYTLDSYRLAQLKFKDQISAEFFNIPPGKLDENLIVTGYQYGRLQYPVARIDVNDVLPEEIFAYSVFENGSLQPNIIIRRYELGSILFTNLPLGYLKAYASDEILLRSILRSYIHQVVEIPFLCKMPQNRGGLVMNWHVDSNRDWQSIPWAEKNDILRRNFLSSIHISAGEWLEKPNDLMGFAAANHPELVKKLSNYGQIGSLGGWAHNWFAINISERKFSTPDIEKYIKINNETLSDITKSPIREYSSPRGLHFSNLTTILEKEGINSFYYVGDVGSHPNRIFFQGKKATDLVFAFPVMANGNLASVQEMGRNRLSAADYEKWLDATLDYLAESRQVTLMLSHFYDFMDFPQYVEPFKRFMNRATELEKEGHIYIQPMSWFADFWQRMLSTEVRYICDNREGLMIFLHHPNSLKDITLAFPKNKFRKTAGVNMEVFEEGNYFYIRITDDIKDKIISLRPINHQHN